MKTSLKKILIMSALTLALSAFGQIFTPVPQPPTTSVNKVTLPRDTGLRRAAQPNSGVTVVPGSFLNDPGSLGGGGSGLVNGTLGGGMGSGLTGNSPMAPNFQPGNIVFDSPGQQPYMVEVDGSGTDHELANMGVDSRMGSGLNGNSPMAPNLQPDSIVIGSPGQPGWVVLGGSGTDSVGPITDTSRAPVMLNGATFQVQLSLALQRGQPLQSFIVFALQNGVTVADITRELLKSGLVPAPVALTALGQVFSGNESLLTVVFSVAITVPEITLDPAAVETAIEAGCGKDCLPASLIAGVTNTIIQVEQQLSLELQSLPLSTLTNSTSSGSGIGTARPVSPAG